MLNKSGGFIGTCLDACLGLNKKTTPVHTPGLSFHGQQGKPQSMFILKSSLFFSILNFECFFRKLRYLS